MFKFAFIGLLAAVTASASPRQLPKDPREWPVVPLWARLGAPEVHGAPGDAVESAVQQEATNCPPMIEVFGMTDWDAAVRYDSALGVTQIYVGDYSVTNSVIRHDITTGLVHTQTSLGIPYGVPWVMQDLDGDGELEMVKQTGDPGFGGNGYLDILSAPDWHLRKRFVFPGMKVVMNAVTVNVTGDSLPELYLTPSSLGGPARAVIIGYDAVADSFRVLSDIAAPPENGGRPAVGDFDGDGRIEFISGNSAGYHLFEWQESTLVYIGKVGDTTYVDNLGATACRPMPGGGLLALLGHSNGPPTGWKYELLMATGDNSFTPVRSFEETTDWIGFTPCQAADVDCDGLDDLVMSFYPNYRSWRWDDALGDFVQSCVWNRDTYGTMFRLYVTDLDRNGAVEFASMGSGTFRSFPGLQCVHCDSAGHCRPPIPCYCPCNGDPQCDSVMSDILDVVQTINVAFRGATPSSEVGCPIERTDVDCSGATDVLDVVKVVNVAFRAADAAAEFCKPCAP